MNPNDLDDGTIRNMHAIGVNFATLRSNKLKPFESKATKKRKWRDYFDEERASLSNTKSVVDSKQEIVDYDGSSSQAERIKILQRRLTAWPTFEQASGLGSEPNQVIGTTISHALDQSSYMNQTDFQFKPDTAGTDKTMDLPVDIRNINTPAGVKSAVGSSRIVARIQMKKLIEQSHVNTLN